MTTRPTRNFPWPMMAAGWALVFAFLGAPRSSDATADMSGIPIATTVDGSAAFLPERIARVLAWGTNARLARDSGGFVLPNPEHQTDGRILVRQIAVRAVARMLQGLPIPDVEAIIEDPRTVPFSAVGSTLDGEALGLPCNRRGDYDFSLIDWLRVAYVSRQYPDALSNTAYERLVRELLTVRGPGPEGGFDLDCLGTTLRLQDTENHVLMIESARYLTNQLLLQLPEFMGDPEYDNTENGHRDWMVRHLQGFFFHFFEEYNSRPYQFYTVAPIILLHSYAEDNDVQHAAGMLLDLLAGWTAVQSNGLRRFPPFRRQPPYILPDRIDHTRGYLSWVRDAEASRLSILAGNAVFLPGLNYELPAPAHALRVVAGAYRMPRPLLDLAIRKDLNPYYVVARHANVEIYASSKSFLISAGGIFREGIAPAVESLELPWPLDAIVSDVAVAISDEQHGWARETVLIPTQEPSASVRDLIRFEGHPDLAQRNNTCVAPGFACGTSVRLPDAVEHVRARCSTRDGNWSFFDFTHPHCPLSYGGYLALYERTCDSDACSASSATNTFGLLEVGEASAQSASDFFASVRRNNPNAFASRGAQSYRTAAGDSIVFEIIPTLHDTSIHSVNSAVFPPSVQSWPLFRGDAVSSSTPGRVSFDSRGTQERMILDFSDANTPRTIRGGRPKLSYSPIQGGSGGRYFDDSDSLIAGDRLAWIEVCGTFPNVGYRARYYGSGLEVARGSTHDCTRLDLCPNETVRAIGMAVAPATPPWTHDARIISLWVQTHDGRAVRAGTASATDVLRAPPGQHVAALFGQAGEEGMIGLGAVFARAENSVCAMRHSDSRSGALPDALPGINQADAGEDICEVPPACADAHSAPEGEDRPGPTEGCPRRRGMEVALLPIAALCLRRRRRSYPASHV